MMLDVFTALKHLPMLVDVWAEAIGSAIVFPVVCIVPNPCKHEFLSNGRDWGREKGKAQELYPLSSEHQHPYPKHDPV